jgi:pimeloyl-ACP methyl ester carboxylesterase
MKTKFFSSVFLMFCMLPAIALAQAPASLEIPDWLANNEKVTSGAIWVPEDHEHPEGRKLQLTYAVLGRKNKGSRAFPVILFSGGPGEQSLQPGLVDFLLTHPFLEDRDIILFDQRGIGYSSPLPDMSFDTFMVMAEDADPIRERKLMDSVVQKYRELCAAGDIRPEYYNTVQNAHDVGQLFKHLGYGKYNLFGGSYGTRLARVVQDLYPGFVHASILDSPSPLNGDFLLDRLESYSMALERILAHCFKTPECNQAYPDLRGMYLRAIEKLKENPIKVRVNDSIDFSINAQDGIYLIRRLLYMGDSKEKAPALIRALYEGSGPVIQEVLAFEWQITGSLNMSMLLSVEKFENFNPGNTARAISTRYSRYPLIPVKLGYFDALYQAGQHWHLGHMPLSSRKFEPSDIPTLIFVNRFDPVTPPENGELFLKDLPRGHLLILDEGGHGQGNRECKEQVMLKFMDAPHSSPGASCLNLYRE